MFGLQCLAGQFEHAPGTCWACADAHTADLWLATASWASRGQVAMRSLLNRVGFSCVRCVDDLPGRSRPSTVAAANCTMNR